VQQITIYAQGSNTENCVRCIGTGRWELTDTGKAVGCHKKGSKLNGDEKQVARLGFAGEALTSPLTKGMLRPFGNPSAMPDSSPPQAVGHSQVLRKSNAMLWRLRLWV
jgi:hypothetical protein